MIIDEARRCRGYIAHARIVSGSVNASLYFLEYICFKDYCVNRHPKQHPRWNQMSRQLFCTVGWNNQIEAFVKALLDRYLDAVKVRV
jgi:hypothetical protein